MLLKSRTALVLFLLSVGLTYYVFSPAIGYEFLNWDDPVVVTQNPEIKDLGVDSVVRMFSSYKLTNYTPIGRISYAIDYHLGGLNPKIFHLTNIIIHSVNAGLMFWLLLTVLSHIFDKNIIENNKNTFLAAAFFGSLIYSLHPLRVESVAWVTERRDVLSVFWLLPAIIFYFKYADSGFQSRGWNYAFWCSWLLSLLSKTTALTLPLVLLLIDYYPLRRFSLERNDFSKVLFCMREKIPHFLVTLAFGLIAMNGVIVPSGYEPFPVSLKLAMTFYYWTMYLLKWLVPWPLSPLYGRIFFSTSKLDASAWLHIAAFLVITYFALLTIKRRPYIFVTWLSYLILIFPFTGAIQTGFGGADRYTLIPTIPFSILVAGLVFFILTNERLRILKLLASCVSVCVVFGLIILTTQQLPVWMNSLTLWRTAVQYAPHEPIPLNNLASSLIERGYYFEGRVFAREAISHTPRYTEGWLNLAIANSLCGETEKARDCYDRALKLDPGMAQIYYGLADLALRGKNYDAATSYLFRTYQMDLNADRLLLLSQLLYQRHLNELGRKYLERSAREGNREAATLLYHEPVK